MRVIAIANFKGGTGKTVTATNMAAVMAAKGERVLLIDADPQHNTSDFYLPQDAGEVWTLTHVLQGVSEPYWPECVTPTGREGLDLLPADMELLSLDLAAITKGGRGELARFHDFLDAIREDDAYDFVIIDCPPSFTAASVAALSEADDVILPTRVDAFSRAGVTELIGQVRSLYRTGAGRQPHCRVLITMADRTNLCRQGAQLLRASGLDVLGIEIRSCVAVGESSYARQPLLEYAPRSTAACDYVAAVNEYLAEIKAEVATPHPAADGGHLPLEGKADKEVR